MVTSGRNMQAAAISTQQSVSSFSFASLKGVMTHNDVLEFNSSKNCCAPSGLHR